MPRMNQIIEYQSFKHILTLLQGDTAGTLVWSDSLYSANLP